MSNFKQVSMILLTTIPELRFQHVNKSRRTIMGFVGVVDYLGSYGNWHAVIYWCFGQTVNPKNQGSGSSTGMLTSWCVDMIRTVRTVFGYQGMFKVQ
jgi:hypothetical protein